MKYMIIFGLDEMPVLMTCLKYSLNHLVHAIACMCTSTCTTSLMHVKKESTTFAYDTYCLGHLNEENENIKLQIE